MVRRTAQLRDFIEHYVHKSGSCGGAHEGFKEQYFEGLLQV